MKPLARLAGMAAALLLVAPGGTPADTGPIHVPVPEAGPMAVPPAPGQEAPAWRAFHIDDVRAERTGHGRPWQEFLRVPDLFSGLYEIPAGGVDAQRPHDADEVYYVVAGQATLTVGTERIPVRPGAIVYVAKNEDHRFIDVTEDLSVVVFFATPGGGA